jgi:hypothetical protein
MSIFGKKKEKSLADLAKEEQDALSKQSRDHQLNCQIASAKLIRAQREADFRRMSLETPSLQVTVCQDVVFSNDGIPIEWVASGLIGTCATVCLFKDGQKMQVLWNSVTVEEHGRIVWELAPRGKDKNQRDLLPMLGNNFQIRFMTDTGFTAFSNFFSIVYAAPPPKPKGK